MEMTGFAVGGNIWDLFGRGKRVKIGGGVGDGARYWKSFLGALGLIEEVKSSCGGKGVMG